MHKFSLILLGDPASGKATHGAVLAKRYDLLNLDMGKLLRALPKNVERKFGVRRKIDQGDLAPTAAVRMIMRRAVGGAPRNRGILFNGWPKMLGEAKLVRRMLEARDEPVFFIYLHIPHSETVRRMLDRRENRRRRADDNPLALRRRIRYYRTNIKEVVALFRTHYPHGRISTVGSIPAVQHRIDDYLKKELNQWEKAGSSKRRRK